MGSPATPESESNIPISRLTRIGRRPILRASVAGILGLIANQLPNLALAQTKKDPASVISRNMVDNPFFAVKRPEAKLDESFDIVALTQAGLTLEEQLNALPYLNKKDIGDDLVAYDYKSLVIDRPNRVIARKGREVLFKRLIVVGTQPTKTITASEFVHGYGPVESITHAPLFYGVQNNKPTPFWQTLIRTNTTGGLGLALVVNRNTQEIFEMHSFSPDTSIEDYIKIWAQGDYSPPLPKLIKKPVEKPIEIAPSKPTPPAPKTKALIIIDGLNSTSLTPRKTFEAILAEISSRYALIAPFGYLGGEMYKRPDLPPDKLPEWLIYPYGRHDTLQDILDKPRVLRDMVDAVRSYVDTIHLLAFSQGSLIAWQYLINELLSGQSPHRGVVTKAALLAGPLAGVPHPIATLWASTANSETLVANENTQFMSAMARTPELQQQTIDNNKKIARKLTEAGVEIITLGSSNDCIVEAKSAVVDEYGKILKLPRNNNFLGCSLALAIATLVGDDAANEAGHGQVLTANQSRAEVKAFFLS